MTEFDGFEEREAVTCDSHIHSKYSFDGATELNDICYTTKRHHVTVITVTDRCDMMDAPEGIDSYLEGERACREKFNQICRNDDGLRVLYGVEIGNTHEVSVRTCEFLMERDIAFVIGAGFDAYDVRCVDLKLV